MKLEHIIQTIAAALCVAMLCWMLQSCKTPQPIVQEVTKEVVVEREVRDTIVTVAPDSASIKALLECDSAGNVLIKELQEVQGKNVSLQAQQMLAALELYALDCYRNTEWHKATINALTTIEEAENYDCTQGYPQQLRLEL